MSSSAAERTAIIKSINWLGRHVPQCVLSELSDEVVQFGDMNSRDEAANVPRQLIETPHVSVNEKLTMELPYATEYKAALLFIDMSGFTKISQELDVESLSKAINSYFQAIVDEVTAHGGDILKFAGDAIFAEWRVEEPNNDSPPDDRDKQSKCSRKESEKKRNFFRKTFSNMHSLHRDHQLRRASDRKKSQKKGTSIQQDTFNIRLTLEDCVYQAAICGATVIKKCANYPIYDVNPASGWRGREIVASLNVHCGLGVGKIVGVHLGNECNRREYLVLGDPIDQVSEACDSAKLGELRASSQVLEYLNRHQMSRNILQCKSGEKSATIASGKRMFLHERKKKKASSIDGKMGEVVAEFDRRCAIPFDTLNISSLQRLQKKLSLYVHPVIVAEENITEYTNDEHENMQSRIIGLTLKRGNSGRILQNAAGDRPKMIKHVSGDSFRNIISSTHERLRSEAELRTVLTIFIMPKIEAKLTGDPEENKKLFQLLNDIMNVITSILDNHGGHLRQYIVDDKGVVLVATFGLRGSTFPDMVSERALPTCRLIQSDLKSELRVDTQIGITLGKVYCGIVGGVERHEYAVLGPSVNLSARLMAQKNHPGILVDNVVRAKAKNFNFIAFPPVKAKGYTDVVPVFKPLTARETRWGKVNVNYVGRKTEMKMVYNLALRMSQQEECPSIFLFVWGGTGSGKSSFLVNTIAKIHTGLVPTKKKFVITRYVCSDGEDIVPFSSFRSIFHDVLRDNSFDDNQSLDSNDTWSHTDVDWDGSSLSSTVTSDSQKKSVASHLREICEQIGAPNSFTELIGHHLLDNSKAKISSVQKAPELADIISFMGKVFRRATSHAEIIILALDDVQWMDNLSWKVVRDIFENSNNVFIVCCARPLEEYALTMEDDFWGLLTGDLKDQGRYYELHMKQFTKSEVREMAALILGCDTDDILDKFIDDIHMHSDGMPYYASEILQVCVRNSLTRRNEQNKISWYIEGEDSQEYFDFTNIDELLLQRIDHFDDLTRKILHFASVLGASFDLRDIINIAENILCTPLQEKDRLSNDINAALKIAVNEGILEEMLYEDDTIDEEKGGIEAMIIKADHDKTIRRRGIYLFSHITWRRLILSLLLDSWKRDIHKYAAMAIEARSSDDECKRDYRTNVKLFQHLKESDNTVKAADIALHIGQHFKMLGLNQESIQIYRDALDMWRKQKCEDADSLVGGFVPVVLESLDTENLVSLIKLLTMLGQAIGSSSNKDAQLKSANVFADALMVLRYAPASTEIKDRAFIFPIYSGIFFLLKYGIQVAFTEDELISNFVNETKNHGDPVHYGRALAMQGEMFHRQGRYEEAIKSHSELKRVYDVEEQHERIVASYASDRVGQNFGCTANCYMRLNQVGKAMEIVEFIIAHLITKMNPKNVHNSVVTIYPAIWILKDNGRADKAKEIFVMFVLKPFHEYFGEDGTTPFLPAFRGIQILLDIVLYMEGKGNTFDERFYDWALENKHMETSKTLDFAIGNFGRNISSTNAEICLRLSKLTKDETKSKKLIECGMQAAELAMSRCDGSDGSSKLLTTYLQIKPVYDELSALSSCR